MLSVLVPVRVSVHDRGRDARIQACSGGRSVLCERAEVVRGLPRSVCLGNVRVVNDPRLDLQLRHAMAVYPTGVALVAAHDGERVAGMLMNSLTSVSLNPPLLSLCFSRTSPTWLALTECEVWGVSILGGCDTEEATRLARPSDVRFDDVELTLGDDGSVVLPDAAARFVVRRYHDVDAGDHVLCLLQVVSVERADDVTPIVCYDSAMSPWHV